MKHKTTMGVACLITGTAVLGGVAMADGARFQDFTPLAASAGPTVNEATPLTLGNRAFRQRSIADRNTQLAANKPDSGNWDMITVNETGSQKGRFIFTVFETGQAGVQRTDRETGAVDTVWYSPMPAGHVAFDASYWTPWGTFITAEESWCDATAGCTSPYGRLFELMNPTTAPGITNPVTPQSNDGAVFPHRNVIPRVSHEGIQFDKDRNMYFIDELNGGSIYKFTSKASWGAIMSGRAGYFDAGQTFVMRVGDGNTPNATGSFTWVPITDGDGNALPGATVITDTRGVTSVDASRTADLPAFRGTDYQRPEDLQIVRRSGREHLYVATTTTNEVYRIDLDGNMVSVFANQQTTDLATGAPVGTAYRSVDNLALDHDGNLYVIEDRPGGVDNDVWFAKDLNSDGDLLDTGEGVGRWASNGTLGSELTGLYFDPTDKRRAWINVQHPASRNDRMIEITIADDDDDNRDDNDRDDDRDDNDRDDNRDNDRDDDRGNRR